MTRLGKQSNRQKNALDSHDNYNNKYHDSSPSTACVTHREDSAIESPTASVYPESSPSHIRQNIEVSNSFTSTVSRSLSTRYPGPYLLQSFSSNHIPVVHQRHHRHASQNLHSSARGKKNKRLFDRMRPSSHRNSTESKSSASTPCQGSNYHGNYNADGLARRASTRENISDTGITKPTAAVFQTPRIYLEPLQIPKLSFSLPHKSAEADIEFELCSQQEIASPISSQNQPTPPIVTKPRPTVYQSLQDDQCHQLQDRILHEHLESPHHKPGKLYHHSGNSDNPLEPLCVAELDKNPYLELIHSSPTKFSEDPYRPATVREVSSDYNNQVFYNSSLSKTQIAQPDKPYMAPSGATVACRRMADTKVTVQTQQEGREGMPSYNKSQFSNQSPTPELSLYQGTQGQSYRGISQRDQLATQNEQGRHTPPLPPAERDVNDNYKELVTKYKKVKGLYFEKTAQVEQLQNTLANQRLSQSRTSLDDSEYMTRFQRLEGAITNLAFNIRKDWRTLPAWLSQYVNSDALKIGKQEMTAVGRAIITKFLADEIFNVTFHPALPTELSSNLKFIERNIRRFSPPPNSQEETEALTAKLIQWRLTTLDGLKDVFSSPESEENKKNFTETVTSNLASLITSLLQEPIPPGVEDSAHMIVELSIGIASNLPLESREISITYPMPGDSFQPVLMKLENPIPTLVDPRFESKENENSCDNAKDEVGKEKKGNNVLQAYASPNLSGKREGGSDAKKADDGTQKIRFAGFLGVEVRGRQVLLKAPVWSLN
ncbi:hypothetical protein BGHDH14_bgh01358 [Blumeria hordei DH14]|uniref:S-adenosylmethionine-dependent methyltransferase-like protein n=1 Tax=Blumeria graminis f. sp. hordei (strain DH14) TaxID=546991 RepID=N1JFL1_BLUG1|nr:hypothetical protein BGHDH14_bgh01358 [Blumeria hordei DH14]